MPKIKRLCDFQNSDSDSETNDFSKSIPNSDRHDLKRQHLINRSHNQDDQMFQSTKKKKRRLVDLDVDSDTETLPPSSSITSLTTSINFLPSSTLITTVYNSSVPLSNDDALSACHDVTAITATDNTTTVAAQPILAKDFLAGNVNISLQSVGNSDKSIKLLSQGANLAGTGSCGRERSKICLGDLLDRRKDQTSVIVASSSPFLTSLSPSKLFSTHSNISPSPSPRFGSVHMDAAVHVGGSTSSNIQTELVSISSDSRRCITSASTPRRIHKMVDGDDDWLQNSVSLDKNGSPIISESSEIKTKKRKGKSVIDIVTKILMNDDNKKKKKESAPKINENDGISDDGDDDDDDDTNDHAVEEIYFIKRKRKKSNGKDGFNTQQNVPCDGQNDSNISPKSCHGNRNSNENKIEVITISDTYPSDEIIEILPSQNSIDEKNYDAIDNKTAIELCDTYNETETENLIENDIKIEDATDKYLKKLKQNKDKIINFTNNSESQNEDSKLYNNILFNFHLSNSKSLTVSSADIKSNDLSPSSFNFIDSPNVPIDFSVPNFAPTNYSASVPLFPFLLPLSSTFSPSLHIPTSTSSTSILNPNISLSSIHFPILAHASVSDSTQFTDHEKINIDQINQVINGSEIFEKMEINTGSNVQKENDHESKKVVLQSMLQSMTETANSSAYNIGISGLKNESDNSGHFEDFCIDRISVEDTEEDIREVGINMRKSRAEGSRQCEDNQKIDFLEFKVKSMDEELFNKRENGIEITEQEQEQDDKHKKELEDQKQERKEEEVGEEQDIRIAIGVEVDKKILQEVPCVKRSRVLPPYMKS